MSADGDGAQMPFTLPGMVADNARAVPDRVAITDTVRSLTYAELEERTNRIARALAGRGIGAGDRVAYLGRNSIEFYPVFFAATTVGAVLVPLNWRLTAADLAFQLQDSGSRLAFTDDEFAASLPAELDTIRIGDEFDAFVADAPDTPVRHEPRPDDIALQPYTSGTSSNPKGVLLTHRNYEAAMAASAGLTIGEGDTVLAVMPVFHIGGNLVGAYPLSNHGTLVMVRAFDPVELPKTIERYGVNQFNLAPTMVSMIADAYPDGTDLMRTVKAVIYGGAPITVKEYQRVRRSLDIPLLQAYAMTEVMPITLLAPHEHRDDRLGSVGRPIAGTDVEVRDPDTFARREAGESGEVWVRSASATAGYWNRPDATARLYSEPGWLRTGDIGHLDEEGFLFLTDRLSDMIITGGENVSPSEVERVLITHPEIDEVSVVGIPDDLWGEAVTAFAVRSPGSSLTADELDAWARERIAGFRRPKHIRFLDQLPRNGAGKILKQDLKREFTA
jgi:acyl-CoA synthetase (AMP-forming)/AMP-acid ligase II